MLYAVRKQTYRDVRHYITLCGLCVLEVGQHHLCQYWCDIDICDHNNQHIFKLMLKSRNKCDKISRNYQCFTCNRYDIDISKKLICKSPIRNTNDNIDIGNISRYFRNIDSPLVRIKPIAFTQVIVYYKMITANRSCSALYDGVRPYRPQTISATARRYRPHQKNHIGHTENQYRPQPYRPQNIRQVYLASSCRYFSVSCSLYLEFECETVH